MSTLKTKWDGLNPAKKKLIVSFGIIASVLLIGLFGYRSSRSSQQTVQKPVEKAKSLTLIDQKYLDKNTFDNTKKELNDTNTKMVDMEKQVKDMKTMFEQLQAQKKEALNKGDDTKAAKQASPGPNLSVMPPPPAPQGGFRVPAAPGQTAAAVTKEQPALEVIGDIAIRTNNTSGKDLPKDKETDKKKEGEKIYLPPSFMQATLLSGLLAPATGGGKGNPVPVLIRINDLAVLPNKLKANLKGCFVIAEGTGDLATERANLRLVSLSCLSKKGHSVVDQKVKGFVVDTDGIVGLHGVVVSKMGATIARTALASLLVGAGDAFKSAGSSTSITGSGVIQSVDPGQVSKMAIGGGVADAAKELQKFYLDLAKQTLPVIETLAQKQVTIVISEGVDLAVKDTCTGGEKCKN